MSYNGVREVNTKLKVDVGKGLFEINTAENYYAQIYFNPSLTTDVSFGILVFKQKTLTRLQCAQNKTVRYLLDLHLIAHLDVTHYGSCHGSMFITGSST